MNLGELSILDTLNITVDILCQVSNMPKALMLRENQSPGHYSDRRCFYAHDAHQQNISMKVCLSAIF